MGLGLGSWHHGNISRMPTLGVQLPINICCCYCDVSAVQRATGKGGLQRCFHFRSGAIRTKRNLQGTLFPSPKPKPTDEWTGHHAMASRHGRGEPPTPAHGQGRLSTQTPHHRASRRYHTRKGRFSDAAPCIHAYSFLARTPTHKNTPRRLITVIIKIILRIISNYC